MYDLQWQSKKINEDKPLTKISQACSIANGICELNQDEIDIFIKEFDKFKGSCEMFIPASGSGSRMFESINKFYFDKEHSSDQLELFFRKIQDFAFYELIPKNLIKDLHLTKNKKTLIHFLLDPEGFNFNVLPKGLIPFHRNLKNIFNPFQDQILQGMGIHSNMKFHFTVQKDFHDMIKSSINKITQNVHDLTAITYSYQSSTSDSFVYDNNGVLVKDKLGNHLKKPSGHGALLENLNDIQSDIIFVKNIDNIQHPDHSAQTAKYFKVLAGLLLTLKSKFKEWKNNHSLVEIIEWNRKFHLFSESELKNDVFHLLNRPLRICGMVKNEGEPGGGPFWMNNGNSISKQIVEGSQIDNSSEQINIFQSASHFNPVFMVLDIKDLENKKYDLNNFANPNRYLKVSKNHDGQDIFFIERPGLWNGGMENWNTIFVEIPSGVFSPVKTVLDLLSPLHQPSN